MMHAFALLIPVLGFALAHEHEYEGKHKIKCSKSTITETVTSTHPATCTACYDAIDECGQTYGGCWNACRTSGVPSFPQPECTPTSIPTNSDYRPVTTKSYKDECTQTICVDKVNECGKKYGGCYNVCETPTFIKPSCPPTDTPTSTPTPVESCTATICADYINDCGMMYGGCYNECESPTFTPPPCPSTPSSKSYSAPETTTIEPCPTICVDNVNACGDWYGGCYPECETPKFTEPPCSVTSSSMTSHPTKSYGYY